MPPTDGAPNPTRISNSIRDRKGVFHGPRRAAKGNEDAAQPLWGQGFGPAAELPLGAERYVSAGSAGDLVAGVLTKRVFDRASFNLFINAGGAGGRLLPPVSPNRNEARRPRFATSISIDPIVGISQSPSNRGISILSRDLFSDRLGLQEKQQIIRSASLRIGSGHVKSTKRMRANHSARALPVDVHVADKELVPRAGNVRGVSRINRARQTVLRIVRHLHGVVEIPSLRHRENRAKDLFLKNTSLRINIRNHRRRNEKSSPRIAIPAGQKPAFLLPNLDISQNRFLRPRADHRAHDNTTDHPAHRL